MLYDPERRWIDKATCRSMDSERFFTETGPLPGKAPSVDIQAHWDKAKLICGRCPVMTECRRDSLGEEAGVWGGLDEWQRWKLRKRLPRAAERWPAELRLEWGGALHRLRTQDVSWTRIRTMTGISDGLAAGLIEEYLADKLARAEARRAAIVDLPLPELVPEALSFPPEDGRRHLWVFHNNVYADAHYRGETADGAWVHVQVKAGRGNSMKWIRRSRCRIYNPQPIQIHTYVGRPDGAKEESLA